MTRAGGHGVFIRGDLDFMLAGKAWRYPKRNLSVFGVTGLSWGPGAPAPTDDGPDGQDGTFGKVIQATITIPLDPGKPALVIACPARIMREVTLHGRHFGVRFDLEDGDRVILNALIETRGFQPTDHIRKYPRIPSDATIRTFPLLATLSFGGENPMICQVGNLSPNGILLSSENQAAIELKPGRQVDLVLDPRGWFPVPIKIHGTICRIVDELNPVSGNLIRYLGVKFTRVDQVNRVAFLDLIKHIVTDSK